MPSINVLMPATSVRPNLSSLRSMSWMISAMARSAGSFNALRSSSTSNVHLSPPWVNSASNMSKRSSPSLGAIALAGYEFEVRLGIDETPYQPSAGDAIDVYALSRDPGPVAQRPKRARPGIDRRFVRHRLVLVQSRL